MSKGSVKERHKSVESAKKGNGRKGSANVNKESESKRDKKDRGNAKEQIG